MLTPPFLHSLYNLNNIKPIVKFENFAGAPILDIKWSSTNPAMFFVLDSKSVLYVFDLNLKGDVSSLQKGNIVT